MFHCCPFPSALRPILASAALGLLWVSPSGAAEPSLETFAFDWAAGRYVSPVVCEVDGVPIRGGRYFEVVIRDPRRGASGLELRFEDLDASEATRCFDDLGSRAAEHPRARSIWPSGAVPGPAWPCGTFASS